MKKGSNMKKVVLVLALCLTVCVSGTLFACAKDNLMGFDVRETVRVKYGEIVDIENPSVAEGDLLLEVTAAVFDSKENPVPVTAGSFTAEDTDGYSIVYTVVSSKGKEYKKTTKVEVDEPLKKITVTYDRVVEVGKPVLINAICEDPSISLTYSAAPSGEASAADIRLDAARAEFTILKVGSFFVITVSAASGAANPFSYTVVAREVMKEGEVESFTAQWRELETFTGGNRTDYSGYKTTDSASSGINDQKGNAATFLSMETNAEYPQIYIYPRGEKEYYEQLITEGYEHISFWIYMKSAKNVPHNTSHKTDPEGGNYNIITTPLQPNVWTEYRFSLTEGSNQYEKSFIGCYDYYKSRTLPYIQISNSVAYDPTGGNDTLTLYVSDVYAVKPAAVTLKTDAPQTYAVGDSENIASRFQSAAALNYFVSFGGSRERIDGNYTFEENGDYVIEASCADYNLFGTCLWNVTVGDLFVLQTGYLKKELTGSTVSIAFTEAEPDFSAISEYLPQITGRTVTKDGQQLSANGTGFTATEAGFYTLRTDFEYRRNGIGYDSFIESIVDVFTQADKTTLVSASGLQMTAGRVYNGTWEKAIAGIQYLSGYEGEANVMKVSLNGTQEAGIALNALYSIEYYRALLDALRADGKDAVVLYKYRLDTNYARDLPRSISFARGADVMSSWSNRGANIGEWYTVMLPLEDLLGFLELSRGNFSGINDGSLLVSGKTVSANWLFKISTASASLTPVDIFLTELKIVETTPLSVVKPAVELIDKNSVESVDVSSRYNTSAHEELYDFRWELIGRDGTAMTIADGLFATAERNGVYVLVLTATKKGQSSGTAVYLGHIDIYDSTTADLVVAEADASGMTALMMYNYDFRNSNKSATAEYVTDTEKGSVMKVTSNADRTGIAINTLHSAEYYEMLLESGTNYSVQYSYKLCDGNGWTEFQMGNGSMDDKATMPVGSWQTRTVTLEVFATWVEAMRGNHEKSLSGELTSDAVANNVTPAKNWLIGENASEFYITAITLVPIG